MFQIFGNLDIFIKEVRDDVYFSKAHLWNGRYSARRSCMWWNYKWTQCDGLHRVTHHFWFFNCCCALTIFNLQLPASAFSSRFCTAAVRIDFLSHLSHRLCHVQSFPHPSAHISYLILHFLSYIMMYKKMIIKLKCLHSIFVQLLSRHPTSRTLTSQVPLLSLIFASDIIFFFLGPRGPHGIPLSVSPLVR